MNLTRTLITGAVPVIISCVCRVRRQTLLKLPDIQFKTSFNPSVSESMWVEAGRAATIDETNFIMTIDI